jgi:hypothetical protein
MAKRRKDFPGNPPPPGMIWVDSKTYGGHPRAARGSKSPAELNDAMKKHGLRLLASAAPAKLIQDALIPFRTNFPGGQIWQKMLKHFARQAKEGMDYSVSGMPESDLNSEYPTSRIMAPVVKVSRTASITELHVEVSYFFNSRFLERKARINGFQITVIFLIPDFVRNRIITLPNLLPVKALDDEAKYSFIQQIPEDAGSWLICFKAESCIDGVPEKDAGHSGKVMCLMGDGLEKDAGSRIEQ